jgi:hypothetical protein
MGKGGIDDIASRYFVYINYIHKRKRLLFCFAEPFPRRILVALPVAGPSSGGHPVPISGKFGAESATWRKPKEASCLS